MQTTPEAIIAEFEVRRREAKDVRRRKILHRTFDIARLAITLIALFVAAIRVVPSDANPYPIFVGVLVFSYLSHELKKRWAIEGRLEELERKTA